VPCLGTVYTIVRGLRLHIDPTKVPLSLHGGGAPPTGPCVDGQLTSVYPFQSLAAGPGRADSASLHAPCGPPQPRLCTRQPGTGLVPALHHSAVHRAFTSQPTWYAPAISAALRWNPRTGSAVPAAAARSKAHCHHAAVQRKPHRLQLVRGRCPRLRLRNPLPVPKPFRGPGLIRLALRLRIQASGPARCIIRCWSSGRTLLLGCHLGHTR
ncbi:hypothetical protein NDU88_004013, partial [Pleurodeles waltl]